MTKDDFRRGWIGIVGIILLVHMAGVLVYASVLKAEDTLDDGTRLRLLLHLLAVSVGGLFSYCCVRPVIYTWLYKN